MEMKPGLEVVVEPQVSIIRTAAVTVGPRDDKTAEFGAGFNCNFSPFQGKFWQNITFVGRIFILKKMLENDYLINQLKTLCFLKPSSMAHLLQIFLKVYCMAIKKIFGCIAK